MLLVTRDILLQEKNNNDISALMLIVCHVFGVEILKNKEKDFSDITDHDSRMPPKSKRKRVIWNNNDCKADLCLRPEGTSSWVQCDECTGW